MKKKIGAFNLWLSQDWHGNIPKQGPMSGSLALAPWQVQLFAGMLLAIAVLVYVALAASGAITWLP
jgi:hypothetical protein